MWSGEAHRLEEQRIIPSISISANSCQAIVTLWGDSRLALACVAGPEVWMQCSTPWLRLHIENCGDVIDGNSMSIHVLANSFSVQG